MVIQNKQNNNLKKIFSELSKELEFFMKLFEKESKSITSLIAHKVELRLNHSSSIERAYEYILGYRTEDYKLYKKQLIYEEKINSHKLTLQNYYNTIFEKYIILKNKLQDFEFTRIQKNTLRLNLIKTNKLFSEIQKFIILDLNSEINELIKIQINLEESIRELKRVLSIQIHISITHKSYKYEIKNYSKLKKLNKNNLETGDIILYDEYELYKKGLITRQIKYFTKSTIMHTSLFYGKENGRFLHFEASGRNRKVSYIGDFDEDPGARHLILRTKKSLTTLQKKRIKTLIKNNINLKFSVLKLYGIALNYVLTRLYKTWFPFLTRGNNIYRGQGVFCSQTIAEIFLDFNINISNNEDYGMLTPIDILNSYELDIIGYIEGPKMTKEFKL